MKNLVFLGFRAFRFVWSGFAIISILMLILVALLSLMDGESQAAGIVNPSNPWSYLIILGLIMLVGLQWSAGIWIHDRSLEILKQRWAQQAAGGQAS